MKRLPLFPSDPLPDVQTVAPLDRDPNCVRCELHKGTPAGKRCLPAEGDPGDILVVMDRPTEYELHVGRPAASPAGRWVRDAIARIAPGRNVVFTTGLGCKVPAGTEPKDLVAPIEACRPYLSAILRDAEPQLVLIFGGQSGQSFLGRSFQPLSVRKGFGVFFREQDDFAGGTYQEALPAYLLGDPGYALRNKLIAKALEEDLRYALTAPLPDFPGLAATYEVVRTMEDAVEALECLQRAAFVATDCETSGMLHEPDFQVDCVAVSDGDRTFVWDRDAIEDPDTASALGAVLEDLDHCTWNGQFDLVAMECDPAIKGLQTVPTKRRRWILNLQSDSRIKRKLFEADAHADLGTSAELIGLGGHKKEAHDLIEAISSELRKWSKSGLLTPTGRKRPPPVMVHVDPTEIPPVWADYLNQGFDAEKFAYRFLDRDVLLRYCARDAYTSHLLEQWCNDRLAENENLALVWDEVAQPAMWAWCRARLAGFPTDKRRVELLRDYLDVEIKKLGKKIEAVEPGLNPNAPQQVVAAFAKRGMVSKRTTITGKAKMDKAIMEEFRGQHPLVDLVLDWKMFRHTQDNFAEGLLPYIRSDGKCHPSFLQDGSECMPAGELVLTDRGYLRVEQVEPGDTVLTHLGRGRKVTAVSRFDPQLIYKVTLSSGHVLRTTGNHAYWNGGQWIRADGLSIGGYVAVHTRLPEGWRIIDGFPGYSVSSWGRVRNDRTGLVLAQQKKGTWGHLKVALKRNGSRKRGPDFRDFTVHQLVLRAFTDDHDSSLEVMHKNGIAWDNTLGNLAWGTSKENKADARKHGTMSHRKYSAQTKLTDEIAEVIRSIPRSELNDREVAETLGVSRELVKDIRLGKKWLPESHVEGKRAQFGLSTVVHVEVLDRETVYGLTVEEDHSHVTGGVVTHNTGRPSSQDPNFFNRLKGRDEKSRVLGTMLRECHTAPEGWSIIEADQGQIEIRQVMDLSDDPTGIEVITSGTDFHMASARKFAEVLGKNPDLVSDIDREQAKTCIAEGELVLTDQGLIPIENLDKNCKVWDGTAWVQHDGVVCHGLKRVISHDGLTATPDHHVYMPDGRCIPLEVAAMDGRIAVGGDGEVPVRYAPHDRTNHPGWESERATSGVPVLQVRGASTGVPVQRDGREDDQLHLCRDVRGSAHPASEGPLVRDVLAVQQPELQAGQALRSPWDRVPVRELRSVCGLGAGASTAPNVPRCGRGQAGQRRALRAWESAARVPASEQQQQADDAPDRVPGGQPSGAPCVGPHEDGQPGLPIRAGVHLEAAVPRCEGGRTLARCDSGRWANVYDILNAGPRHRFTVSGKVVANSNFAAIYELPDQLGFMLSKRIGISKAEGDKLATALFGSYKNLLPWMMQCLKDSTERGYSITDWKGQEARHRPLWHLGLPEPSKSDRSKDTDKTRWQNHARSSWNGRVQGGAVDIITSQLWPVIQWLDANTNGGEFLLQIYDSIMLLVRDEEVDKTVTFLRQLMTDTVPGQPRVGYMKKVPLSVDVKVGKSWGALSKVPDPNKKPKP